MIVELKEKQSNKVQQESIQDNQSKEVNSNSPLVPKEPRVKRASFFKLMYTLSNKCDIIVIICAIVGSLIAGAAMPLISLLLGKVLNQFNGNIETTNVPELVSGLIVTFLLVGLAIFLGSFMMVFFWSVIGRRMINKINEDYFKVIMRQEQGWFDQSNMFEFATKVQGQVKTIENGVSKNSFMKFIKNKILNSNLIFLFRILIYLIFFAYK
jgi:ABC-type multidrug transport system fused ATPase/permease subunit